MLRRVFMAKGNYFHFKSEEWSKEVAEMPTALCSYWLPELMGEYKLPILEVKFAIVKTQRTTKAH
jgi:16S rRNA (guanine527-N7)-methyltransferase